MATTNAPTDDSDDGTDPRTPSDAGRPTEDVATAVHAARETVRVERRRVVDEHEAFEAFRSRVRRVRTESSPTDGLESGYGGIAAGGAARARGIGSGGGVSGNGLVAVRDAYTATVMSVPHYDEEYNDTYETSLAAEFGPDLALALTQEASLHDRYKRSLLSKTTAAIEERDAFADALDAEAGSIDRAANRLLAVLEEVATLSRTDRSALGFGALDAYRARTTVLTGECDAVAERRQRDLAEIERTLRLGDGVPDVATYLYQDLAVTYPVLATIGVVGERLTRLRHEIEREMAYR
ncbi:hypothetical protein GRS48_11055 [Halorubrum sp. JWXQ-INN 858]|uniref:DUF7260 family protein n=1 Tax=Halorubrum sp. JWXQ-INN 858 TaxID=2690782 RepID=UPI00135AE2EA|nr:hypothetical protein [Halorubrum sp. JWXQ-INN 858]MWV65353.1 hypothetical protein [Halorubrum sp. JWXQ-INN 858]